MALTDEQEEQVDTINNIAHRAMCELLGENLDWDIEWIGELSDAMVDIAVTYFGRSEMELYPYFDEEDEDEADN